MKEFSGALQAVNESEQKLSEMEKLMDSLEAKIAALDDAVAGDEVKDDVLGQKGKVDGKTIKQWNDDLVAGLTQQEKEVQEMIEKLAKIE